MAALRNESPQMCHLGNPGMFSLLRFDITVGHDWFMVLWVERLRIRLLDYALIHDFYTIYIYDMAGR